MENQQGIILPIIIVVVVVALLGTAGYFAYKQYSAPKPVACTMEAKLCPDGSAVGRTGPNCEFAECPAVQDETADWQTYTNDEYGFELKYPVDFISSVSNCFEFKKDGEKMSVSNAVKIENHASGIYILICNFPANYEQMSKQNSSKPVVINNYNAYLDKFIIRGGGRAYYNIEKDNNSSIFIDANWAYPSGSTSDEDLVPGGKMVDDIISTFKFTK